MVLLAHLWVLCCWSPRGFESFRLPRRQENRLLHVALFPQRPSVTEKEFAGPIRHTSQGEAAPLPVSAKKAALRQDIMPSDLLAVEKKLAVQGADESYDRPQEQQSLAPSLSVAEVRVPLSLKLHYEITGVHQGVPWQSGMGALDWVHQGDAYSLAFAFPHRTGKLRTQTSRGGLSVEEGLVPVRFGDRHQSERAAHFQRTEGAKLVRFSANLPPVQLQSHAQDQLSVVVQLAAIVSGQIATGTPANRTVSFQVATAQDAATWTFNIEFPTDPADVIYVTKTPTHRYDGRWELWLAPELSYFPAKWRVSLYNGDFYQYQQTSAAH
ncbi:MAG: hypothetical protein RLZZ612_2262 [Pseudomonadota bacterium]